MSERGCVAFDTVPVEMACVAKSTSIYKVSSSVVSLSAYGKYNLFLCVKGLLKGLCELSEVGLGSDPGAYRGAYDQSPALS